MLSTEIKIIDPERDDITTVAPWEPGAETIFPPSAPDKMLDIPPSLDPRYADIREMQAADVARRIGRLDSMSTADIIKRLNGRLSACTPGCACRGLR